jgi:hypothetical protein
MKKHTTETSSTATATLKSTITSRARRLAGAVVRTRSRPVDSPTTARLLLLLALPEAQARALHETTLLNPVPEVRAMHRLLLMGMHTVRSARVCSKRTITRKLGKAARVYRHLRMPMLSREITKSRALIKLQHAFCGGRGCGWDET